MFRSARCIQRTPFVAKQQFRAFSAEVAAPAATANSAAPAAAAAAAPVAAGTIPLHASRLFTRWRLENRSARREEAQIYHSARRSRPVSSENQVPANRFLQPTSVDCSGALVSCWNVDDALCCEQVDARRKLYRAEWLEQQRLKSYAFMLKKDETLVR